MAEKKKIIFEVDYRPENVKVMQQTLYLGCLGSFLVFKKEI